MNLVKALGATDIDSTIKSSLGTDSLCIMYYYNNISSPNRLFLSFDMGLVRLQFSNDPLGLMQLRIIFNDTIGEWRTLY